MSLHPVNGLNLWIETHGAGPPVLVIMGSGGDLRRKPNIFDAPLTRTHTVASYDQRGLGQSDKPVPPYSMADYADDAAGVLDALGWDKVPVMGISFGGMVALQLAVRHPQRIEKLVLCCTSPGGEGGASYPLHEVQDLPPAERTRFMMPISDTRHDAQWQADNIEAVQQAIAIAEYDPWADEPGRAMGARAQLEARRHHDVWDRLPDIAAPTLICGGRYDGIALPQTQTNMQAAIPGARLEFFEGGHLFLIQDRRAYGVIGEFLDG